MAVTARSHPADHAAVVPDRLVPGGIGIARLDREGEEAQRAAAVLLFQRRSAADEALFLQIDEAAEPGLVGTVDGPVLARPGAEALLEAHGIQCPAAEEPQVVLGARSDEQVIERALIFAGHPDLVAEIAGEGDAADLGRDHAEIHLAEAQEREARCRDIVLGEALQQLARPRARDREARELRAQGTDGDAAIRKLRKK